MPPQDSDQARWFAEHLQAHEPMLRAWLQHRFPKLTEVDDIVQESYTRVLVARGKRELQSPKAFFFATARNLAVEYFRKYQNSHAHFIREGSELAALEDADDVSETVSRKQEIEIVTQAIQALPKRCRQVMTLWNVYGLSQKQIAEQLGISVRTVETQVALGVKRCTRFGERFRTL